MNPCAHEAFRVPCGGLLGKSGAVEADAGAGDPHGGPRAGSARQPQNLISHDLRRLRAGGLVTARGRSLDRRDTSYNLDLGGCAQALASTASALGCLPPVSAVVSGRQPCPAPPGGCTWNSG
jgi:hypothetical protein